MTLDLQRGLGSVALALALCGCRAERHIYFTSDPPGAQLRVDGELVGRTPYDLRFEAYGSRHVTMQRQGYRRYTGVLELKTPWYSYFPLDFISEILLPFGWKDIHRLEVTLEPHTGEVTRPDLEGDLLRAESLRRAGPAGPYEPAKTEPVQIDT